MSNPYGSGFGGGYGRQTTAPASAAPARAPAPAAGGVPTASGDLVKDTTTAAFSTDVIRESRNQPVLVDFWAPWCGPCKQLTPILERVVQAAGGRVKLVKMNIDEHPSIAGQLGVQSIPAVFAFVNGQPVDGFMGALPESEVRAFVDRLAGPGGAGAGDPVAEALKEAGELLKAGDAASAAQVFAAVLQHDPENAAAAAGLAECYLAAGDTARARAVVDQLPPAMLDDPAFATVKTKLKLADEIGQLGDAATLQARLEGDPDDHQARFDLALIAQAKGDREAAAGHLLEIIRRDRSFDDDGARRKLLEFFEVWGPTDPATKEGRRKLSSLLFR
ncbi:thioredoxin [Aureimonas jatrophae]|uniref:Thioredoxin n=1 Tax=Aureimonas jatrophae TaxID=1166073 RepID=A0A1H0JZS6_9HYPH|nr:thioredoxin [Aureimonas jatrophae]MBB3950880.1 putative thioredoxin [Aureimonas jatrophae]SDO49164.1 thioredoxin [Aureimonas jatrophae]